MKKLFFSLVVILFAATSCQEETAPGIMPVEEVPVVLDINVPELGATRGDETIITGLDSALGAIDNFDAANLWGEYDIRYILEVYEITSGSENLSQPIINRMVNILDNYQPTTFKTRLVPNREYRFVVWADFVAQDSYLAEDPLKIEGLCYNASDLKNITPTKWSAMDESRDAYFVTADVYIKTTLERELTLKRPFGKLRVITTDLEELNYGSKPYKVKVTYYNHPIYDSLNAITGRLNTTTKDLTYEFTVDKTSPYTAGDYDSQAANQTLFVDYLYAGEDQSELNFIMEVREEDGRMIKSLDFCTQIPLQRNHLTTVIGKLLTIESLIGIDINDNFMNDADDEDWIIPAE